jgi:hypothetical protein
LGAAYWGIPRLSESLPNALDIKRLATRHFFQDAAVNSERLDELNTTPFNPDVAYAAIAGTDITLKGLDLYNDFAPWRGLDASYFPWMKTFDSGTFATDAVVPKWSALLGVTSHNATVFANHNGLTTERDVFSYVQAWLNGTTLHRGNDLKLTMGTYVAVPLGLAQRAAWTNEPPLSVRNAYVGSTVQDDGTSKGAGLNRDAIIKLEIIPEDILPTYGAAMMPLPGNLNNELRPIVMTPNNILGTSGFQPVATGMIQAKNISFLKVRLVAPHTQQDWDTILDQVDFAPNGAFSTNATAGLNDWVRFRIPFSTVTRLKANGLKGRLNSATAEPGHFILRYEFSIDGGTIWNRSPSDPIEVE